MTGAPRSFGSRFSRLAVLVAGLLLAQGILMGSSLLGWKIHLPVDVLALASYYLPQTPEYAAARPLHPVLSDQVLIYEPQRWLAAEEIRAGRWPLWTPGQYGGAPFATFAKYSPFHLPYYLFPGPRTLAFLYLLQVLVAGGGAFLFFRRVVRISFWPAVVGAWCWPLGGFFVFWQGYPMPPALAWFPWGLVLIEAVMRRPSGYGGPTLAVLTAVLLLSGQVDFAGQVLLASGLYALGRLSVLFLRKRDFKAFLRAAGALCAAWFLGILLAAPYLLPILDYVGSSARLDARGEGFEPRPPVGLAALPQAVVPGIYGSMRDGSMRVVDGNQIESSAAAYMGLTAALLLSPLAFSSRRHRPQTLLWSVLGFLGLVWLLNVPGLVTLLRLPGLNMFSHNRFVFLTGFALLTLATVALEMLRRGSFERRGWFLLPVVLLVALGGWCFFRAENLPEPVHSQLEAMLQQGLTLWTLQSPDDAFRIREGFRATYLVAALWCSLAVLGWLAVCARGPRPWLMPALAALWLLELLSFAFDKSPQGDPELYYPRLPALERLAAAEPGRMLCVRCLPPGLAESHGLKDVRGLDGIEPARMLKVLRLAQDTRFPSPDYAVSMWYVPQVRQTAGALDLPPVLDMLGLRYLVFRGVPDPTWRPAFVEADYWVLENEEALPRAFVPRRVETIDDGETILQRMVADFDPREVAFVERPVPHERSASGAAVKVIEELPGRITVDYDLPSSSLVVLSENWDAGWRAFVDGRPVETVRANYTLNAAAVPAGRGRLVFEFAPVSLRRSLVLAALAILAVATWLAALKRRSRG